MGIEKPFSLVNLEFPVAPKFGTSGLRGLVTELTDDLVGDYTRAFIDACPHGSRIYVGQDLRPSSESIGEVVIRAIREQGVEAVDCGVVPTPALALAAKGAGAVMITGSHIPADRNGLKFYVPTGEVSKADEQAIVAAYDAKVAPAGKDAQVVEYGAIAPYVDRYARAFGDTALAGLRIGVYQHSSVARDVMMAVIERLGGEAVALARSDTFIPVDTEAVDQGTRDMLRGWCAEHGLSAVISTDGDADRPMVTDGEGNVIPGDILGVLTARMLGAEVVCTPVSSNSVVEMLPEFGTVHMTRIGSPFVIAAMEEALAEEGAKVVGFEANGGFLLGFEADAPAGKLEPLMTRDSILPIVAPLAAAKVAGRTVAELVAELPPRFTAADRVTETPTDKSKALLGELSEDAAKRSEFFSALGGISNVDQTDGLRVTFDSGDVVHLRPSGNAPEFRVYAEACTPERARELVDMYMETVGSALR